MAANNPNDPSGTLQVVWLFFQGMLPAGLTLADFAMLKANNLTPTAIFSGGGGGDLNVTLTYPSTIHTGDPWVCAGSDLFPPAAGAVGSG